MDLKLKAGDTTIRPPATLQELSGWPARAYAFVFLLVSIQTWIKEWVCSAFLPTRRLSEYTFDAKRRQIESILIGAEVFLSENDRIILELSHSMSGAKGVVSDLPLAPPGREKPKSAIFEFVLKERRQVNSLERRAMNSSHNSLPAVAPLDLNTMFVEDYQTAISEAKKARAVKS